MSDNNISSIEELEELKLSQVSNNDLKEEIIKKETRKMPTWEKIESIRTYIDQNFNNQKINEILDVITFGALWINSSDIHFENTSTRVTIRMRIDWILTDIYTLSKEQYKLILEKIKYLSKLKLNITNIPQDWKYKLIKENIRIDIRVSSLPTTNWENLVCRVLDASKAIVDFEDLWFFWTTKRILTKSIEKKNWMILITWPTWSGKTTTLYTILTKLNTPDKKIITLEDPIEYEMNWIVQSEVAEKEWYTYDMWLKALLRQDPDVIMLWEIRDYDTLNIATQASLTWHLVLSTLHTKSAAETLDRIINMWLKPYILAWALDTIVSQRLIRKVCSNCKQEKVKSRAEEHMIKHILSEIWINNLSPDLMKLYHWTWCEECNNTWYKWRIWVYEVLSLNDNIRNLIREWATASEIVTEAQKQDMISMKQDWILKAIKWFTTIEEVLRVI